MKLWKYGICLLTAACLLSGCTGKEEPDSATEEPVRPDYYVGVEEANAPYYTLNDQGTASGFYVDLMNTLSERGGFSYEFRAMSAAGYAAQGAMSAITDSDTQAEAPACDLFLGTLEPEVGEGDTFILSEPICETGLCVLIPKGEGIRSTKQLRSRLIASRAMTEEAVFSEYLAASYDAETITFQNGADAFADMTEGYADAIVSDAANAALLLQQNPDTKLLLTSEKYHNLHRFAGTAASGLPEEITDTLEAIRADGTLDALLSQYGLGGTAGTQAAD